jgi:hypothetical protein
MMHRTGWLGAHLASFALVDAFRDDGLGGVFAGFKLRSCGLFFGSGFVGADFSMYLLRGNVGAAFPLLPIGRADLHERGLGRDGLGDMRIHLRLIATR